MTQPPDQQEYEGTVQLCARPSPAGDQYLLTITIGDDWAAQLAGPDATGYAMALIAAATEAEHDAALCSLFRTRGIPDDVLASALGATRDHRSQRPSHLGPLHGIRYAPVVGATTGDPYIHAFADGGPHWQWTPDQAREHAHGALDVLAAAACDDALLSVLTGECDLPVHTARHVIHDLSNHWPARS